MRGGREAGLSTDRATPTEATGLDSDSGDALIPTAQDAYDDYAAGDFGRFYDSWSAESQALIGRDGYTDRIESCPAITTKIEATKASENDDGSWTVRWEAGELLGTDSWIEEGGKWRFVVTDEVAALDSC